MRTGLIPHLGQQVLCKGWIASWKDLEGLSTRQVVVKNPTIRKPDRNLRFEKQTLLTKEDHLNLFIEHKDLPNYDATFQLHASIQFSGVVQDYVRSDGSTDYGIYAGRQSTLPFEIEKVCLAVGESYVEEPRLEQLFRHTLLPKAEQLLEDLEEAGDRIPTFRGTYSTYKEKLQETIQTIRLILVHIHSRSYRRSKGRRPSPLDRIRELGS